MTFWSNMCQVLRCMHRCLSSLCSWITYRNIDFVFRLTIIEKKYHRWFHFLFFSFLFCYYFSSVVCNQNFESFELLNEYSSLNIPVIDDDIYFRFTILYLVSFIIISMLIDLMFKWTIRYEYYFYISINETKVIFSFFPLFFCFLFRSLIENFQ